MRESTPRRLVGHDLVPTFAGSDPDVGTLGSVGRYVTMWRCLQERMYGTTASDYPGDRAGAREALLPRAPASARQGGGVAHHPGRGPGRVMIPAEIAVTEGDSGTLSITSGRAFDFHLHGYDLERSVVPGFATTLTFPATLTGRFAIEDEVVAAYCGPVPRPPGDTGPPGLADRAGARLRAALRPAGAALAVPVRCGADGHPLLAAVALSSTGQGRRAVVECPSGGARRRTRATYRESLCKSRFP